MKMGWMIGLALVLTCCNRPTERASEEEPRESTGASAQELKQDFSDVARHLEQAVLARTQQRIAIANTPPGSGKAESRSLEVLHLSDEIADYDAKMDKLIEKARALGAREALITKVEDSRHDLSDLEKVAVANEETDAQNFEAAEEQINDAVEAMVNDLAARK